VLRRLRRSRLNSRVHEDCELLSSSVSSKIDQRDTSPVVSTAEAQHGGGRRQLTSRGPRAIGTCDSDMVEVAVHLDFHPCTWFESTHTEFCILSSTGAFSRCVLALVPSPAGPSRSNRVRGRQAVGAAVPASPSTCPHCSLLALAARIEVNALLFRPAFSTGARLLGVQVLIGVISVPHCFVLLSS
jgi:hypothetical protein